MDIFSIIAIMVMALVAFIVHRSTARTDEGIRRMEQEQHLLGQRIDYLRREVDKISKNLFGVENGAVLPSTSVQPPPMDKSFVEQKSPILPPVQIPVVKVILPSVPPPLPPTVNDRAKIPVPEIDWRRFEAHLSETQKKGAEADQESEPGLADKAGTILRKIWSWILVNEESRPVGVSTEYAVVTTWAIRIGIVSLILCLASFLILSIQRNLIPKEVRVGIGFLAGALMMFSGLKLVKGKYNTIGQGLIGGGILALYFSSYAAGPSLYGLISSVAVIFGLMLVITIIAGFISIKIDSLTAALFGLAGGYLSPIFLRAEAGSLHVLYGYLLILGLGILGVSLKKQWRLLNYLGFIFTYVVFGWSLRGYDNTWFVQAMCFLVAYFAIHAYVVYINCIRNHEDSTPLEIVHSCANAVMFSYFAYGLIKGYAGGHYPAIMTLGLSAFYALNAYAVTLRKITDKYLLSSASALACLFLALTMPVLFDKQSLTISFAMLGLFFLWVGYATGCNTVRNIAYIMYLVLFGRIALLDVPMGISDEAGSRSNAAAYYSRLVPRLWNFGTVVFSLFAGMYVSRKYAKQSDTVVAGDDMPTVDVKPVRNLFYWVALAVMLVYMMFESNACLGVCFDPLRLPMLTVILCSFGGYFLFRFCLERHDDDHVSLWVMGVLLSVAILKMFVFDLASWSFGIGAMNIYSGIYSIESGCMRTLDFGAIIILAFSAAFYMRNVESGKSYAPSFGYAGLLIMFIYASLEINTLLYYTLPGFRSGGVSVLWAVFAIAFIAVGIWKGIASLRYVGLNLLAVTILKMFLLDLKSMGLIYRIFAFFVLGVVLISCSFIYIRAGELFSRKPVRRLTKSSDDAPDAP